MRVWSRSKEISRIPANQKRYRGKPSQIHNDYKDEKPE